VRREYRHTYRARPTGTEVIVAGAWWDEDGGAGDGTEARPARVSLEVEIAEDLAVGLGDTLTWDVAGRPVASVVTSLREVDWNRFETNFFVVFEPGVLEEAPHSSVLLTRLEGQSARDEYLRALVAAYPNVAALDVTRVQEAIEGILGKVDGAVRFLAGFSALAGVLVLAAALATSRYQRMREGALLRTLGARRPQVLAILAAEYTTLGALAAFTGLALATGAAALVARGMFEIEFVPAPGAMVAVWAGVTVLTLATGLLGSRSTLTRPPLPVLRETVD
jgi:putative ABC transport system permease protein